MVIIPSFEDKGIMHQDMTFGAQLRDWRQRRRMSQLDLASEADLSTRHLSFVETGRSKPSREMVTRIAEALELPLRSRNSLLVAAGFAPAYPDRPLEASPVALAVVQRILDCHTPFPALAVDRHWQMVAHNPAVAIFLSGVAPALLEPPVNVLRLSLHPQGLAGAILNLAEWKRHIIERLRHQVAESGHPALEALAEELQSYPAPASKAPPSAGGGVPIAVPLTFASPAGPLSFLSTTTVFGTPVEVTLSELAIETFFPADAVTAQRMAELTGIS